MSLTSNNTGGDRLVGTLDLTALSPGAFDVVLSAATVGFDTDELPFFEILPLDNSIPDLLASVTVVTDGERELAEATINTPEPVDLGVFRVGDSVTPVPLSITNTADAGFENLNAAAGTTTDGVVASGSFNGLAPQATNDTDITVSIDTSSAGDKSGQATIDFESQNGEEAFPLPSQTLDVLATVNSLANPVINEGSGDGSLTGSGLAYTLDFGSIVEGTDEVLTAVLSLVNMVGLPADLLDGLFDLSALGDFLASGFVNPIDDLAPGDDVSGLEVTFDTTGLDVGSYTGEISLTSLLSVFDGLDDVALDDITLNILGQVTEEPPPNGTPVPSPLALLLLGLVSLRIVRPAKGRNILPA